MLDDTHKIQQPYQFHKLTRQRVMIVNPSQAKLTLHETQIRSALESGSIYYRDLTSHERIMLEQALKELESK